MKLLKPRKHGDAYRIELMFNGKRISATRDTEKECEQWAMLKLLEIKTEQKKEEEQEKLHYPLSALFYKYYEDIGKHKKSKRSINISINHFINTFPSIAEMSIYDITPQILTEWCNVRIKQASIGTVLRDISVFSAILSLCCSGSD